MDCEENRRDEWLKHVTEVFVNTPMQYFVNHLDKDPNAKLQDAIVAIDKEKDEIASTIRFIKRKINLYHQDKLHLIRLFFEI